MSGVQAYKDLGYTPDNFLDQSCIHPKRLYAAVMCGMPVEEVISLIHLGVSVNHVAAFDGPGTGVKTVLVEAVESNSVNLTRVLLYYGANPNWDTQKKRMKMRRWAPEGVATPAQAEQAAQAEEASWNPVMAAVQWGDAGVGVATLLLVAGAKGLNDASEGYTPLMLAVKKGAKRMVHLLLAAGASTHGALTLATRGSLGCARILRTAIELRKHQDALQVEQLDMWSRKVELTQKLLAYGGGAWEKEFSSLA